MTILDKLRIRRSVILIAMGSRGPAAAALMWWSIAHHPLWWVKFA